MFPKKIKKQWKNNTKQSKVKAYFWNGPTQVQKQKMKETRQKNQSTMKTYFWKCPNDTKVLPTRGWREESEADQLWEPVGVLLGLEESAFFFSVDAPRSLHLERTRWWPSLWSAPIWTRQEPTTSWRWLRYSICKRSDCNHWLDVDFFEACWKVARYFGGAWPAAQRNWSAAVFSWRTPACTKDRTHAGPTGVCARISWTTEGSASPDYSSMLDEQDGALKARPGVTGVGQYSVGTFANRSTLFLEAQPINSQRNLLDDADEDQDELMSLQSSVQHLSDATSPPDNDVLHYTLVASDTVPARYLQSFRTPAAVMNSAAGRVNRRAAMLANMDAALWLHQKGDTKRRVCNTRRQQLTSSAWRKYRATFQQGLYASTNARGDAEDTECSWWVSGFLKPPYQSTLQRQWANCSRTSQITFSSLEQQTSRNSPVKRKHLTLWAHHCRARFFPQSPCPSRVQLKYAHQAFKFLEENFSPPPKTASGTRRITRWSRRSSWLQQLQAVFLAGSRDVRLMLASFKDLISHSNASQ